MVQLTYLLKNWGRGRYMIFANFACVDCFSTGASSLAVIVVNMMKTKLTVL